MAEANDSVHQAQVRATMGAATITLARRAAIKATKAELHAQGLRPNHIHVETRRPSKRVPRPASSRAIAEAKEIVERWLGGLLRQASPSGRS